MGVAELACDLTGVVREAGCQRRLGDLDCKQVCLVEKQDDRGVEKPSVIADTLKQLHALNHTILHDIIICLSVY